MAIGRAPREVQAAITRFLVGALVVVGAIAVALWQAGPWIAAVVAFLVVTPMIAWYERAYADAAAAARARLG